MKYKVKLPILRVVKGEGGWYVLNKKTKKIRAAKSGKAAEALARRTGKRLKQIAYLYRTESTGRYSSRPTGYLLERTK